MRLSSLYLIFLATLALCRDYRVWYTWLETGSLTNKTVYGLRYVGNWSVGLTDTQLPNSRNTKPHVLFFKPQHSVRPKAGGVIEVPKGTFRPNSILFACTHSPDGKRRAPIGCEIVIDTIKFGEGGLRPQSQNVRFPGGNQMERTSLRNFYKVKFLRFHVSWVGAREVKNVSLVLDDFMYSVP
ncbi:hypothetical protein AJ79_00636 [Helicocarpus griseus UAMH5409]|uniref:Uncharacterized protein n=1 Tax=Helicocarpus griseus UAMH5409 TaxID=1447875 RepID=A0A2B7YCH6_9EURO|nr:hypothetical protein AJ79_00636 [Helicocarpus griseus UAMH5409]